MAHAVKAVATPAADAGTEVKPYVPESATIPEFTPRAVILGMLVTMFPKPSEQAKAISSGSPTLRSVPTGCSVHR